MRNQFKREKALKDFYKKWKGVMGFQFSDQVEEARRRYIGELEKWLSGIEFRRRQFALTIEHDRYASQEQYELGDLEGIVYDAPKSLPRNG